jgi:hypothetical protein
MLDKQSERFYLALHDGKRPTMTLLILEAGCLFFFLTALTLMTPSVVFSWRTAFGYIANPSLRILDIRHDFFSTTENI